MEDTPRFHSGCSARDAHAVRLGRAFTLIETLAVIVLLSLASAIGAMAIGSRTDAERLRDDAGVLIDLDRQARLSARRLGPVAMEADLDHARTLLRHGNEILTERSRIRVHLFATTGGRQAPVDEIVFDRRGRTDDYVAELTRGEARLALEIAGLTGWAEVRAGSALGIGEVRP